MSKRLKLVSTPPPRVPRDDNPSSPMRLAVLAVLSCLSAIAFYFASAPQTPPVPVLAAGIHNVTCARRSKDDPFVAGCSTKRCARVVVDDFISRDEAAQLIRLIQTGVNSTGGGSGGPSVLELTTGAVSSGENFVDVYKAMERQGSRFQDEDIRLYSELKERILGEFKAQFGLRNLWLTKPCFFSQIEGDSAKPARTEHDEYWHNHVDRLQYPGFSYTALVYLNDYNVDFTGGRFVYVDREDGKLVDKFVEPKAGRLSMFTSSSENTHRVEKVQRGTRYALTIAFTCDEAREMTDFLSRFSAILRQS